MWENKTLLPDNYYVKFPTEEEKIEYTVDWYSQIIEIEEAKYNSIIEYARKRYGEDNLDSFFAPLTMNSETYGDSDALVIMLGLIGLYENKDWLYSDKKIVVTGSIDGDGNVLKVGSVNLKAVSAEKEHADIFIVPKEQVEEAYINIGKRTDLKVIGVDTIEEALNWLEKNG